MIFKLNFYFKVKLEFIFKLIELETIKLNSFYPITFLSNQDAF